MASRFEIVDEEYIEELKDKSEKHEEKHRLLEECFHKLGEWKKLPRKFRRLRQRYPQPNTIAVLCRVTKRKRGWLWARLPESNAGITGEIPKIKSLSKVHHLREREFLNFKKALEGKARKLREQGKGKRPNQSKSLTKEEEGFLWQKGQLSGGTPRALLNTMWWLLTLHLAIGLRGRQEHHQMKVEDFTLQRDDDDNEFFTFAVGPTKTRQGGLIAKIRLVTPKMFATGNEEGCPAMLFKRNLCKRPSEREKNGPFYLTVMDKPVSSILYKKTPIGKNTINTIMKNIRERTHRWRIFLPRRIWPTIVHEKPW